MKKERLTFRLSVADKEQIKSRAEALRLSVSSYILSIMMKPKNNTND